MNLKDKIQVLDGFVQLVRVDGYDDEISRFAGISHNSDKGPSVSDLIDWGHTSPFEFAHITFKVEVPIFVDRHIVRHRTQTRMEKSLRYCKAKDIKVFNPFDDDELKSRFATLIQALEQLYKDAIDKGVKKEDARVVLPLGLYTTYYIQFDLRNFMNFLDLRMDKATQWETRELATAMATIFSEQFPLTAKKYFTKKE